MNCLSKEQIELYLSGKTSKELTRQIELHIADCELCGDAVEGIQQARLAQSAPKRKKTTLTAWVQMASAACVVWAIVWASQKIANLKIENPTLDSELALMQKAIEDNEGSLNFALKLFQIREYGGALLQFKEIQDNKPAPSLYYAALCQIKLGDYSAAHSSLQKLLHCCRFKTKEAKSLLQQIDKRFKDNS